MASMSSSRENSSAPAWQGDIYKRLFNSTQTSSFPALDSDVLSSISDSLPSEDKIVCLNELATQFSSLLPLRVKIVTGFCAENDKDPTLDVDDIYNIHLLKRTDLVTICDVSGEHYKIPLYSSLQFGLIYEQRNEAKVFASVNEIMKASPLPKVVVALEQYDGRSKESSLSPNDLLVIQSVYNKNGAKNERSSLKAYCVTTNTHKDLQSDCVVRFTTDPRLTKMYLSDLMEFASNLRLLPCKARLYFDESTVTLPPHLSREVVTIQKKHTNPSFLISLETEKHRQGKQIEVNELIDIPTNTGICVCVISPRKSMMRYKKLYDDTVRILLQEFNPMEVLACIDAPSDDVYVTQAQLLSQVRSGYETMGHNIVTPALIEEYQPLLTSTLDSTPQYEDLDFIQRRYKKEIPHLSADVLPTTGIPPNTRMLPRADMSQPASTAIPWPSLHGALPTSPRLREAESTLADVKVLSPSRKLSIQSLDEPPLLPPRNSSCSARDSIVQNVEVDVDETLKSGSTNALLDVTKALASLEKTVSQLSERVDLMEKQLSSVVADIAGLKAVNGIGIGGLQSLQLMSRDGVLQLLDNLNMPQYKDAFKQEMVDGEILLEIDEVVLEQELGMKSKLHRLRLLKYIDSCRAAA